jgi:hypothetical protein
MVFYIIPPRKFVSSPIAGGGYVASLNNLTGAITLSVGSGMSPIQSSSGNIQLSVNTTLFVKRTVDDTVTANLKFIHPGSGYGLKLHTRSDAEINPVAGPSDTGAVYFNTSVKRIRVYDGLQWIDMAAEGTITSIEAGDGLKVDGGGLNPIVTAGIIAIDKTQNFTWTGSHVYSQAITFASGQTFDGTRLRVTNQQKGAIIYALNSGNANPAWRVLNPGSPGDVLTISSNSEPIWSSNPDVSAYPRWYKVVVRNTDLAYGDTTAKYPLFTLPAGGFVHAVKIKTITAFAKVGSSYLNANVGNLNVSNKYSNNFDLRAAVTDTSMLAEVTEGGESHVNESLLYLHLSSDATLSGWSAGEVHVFLFVSVAA